MLNSFLTLGRGFPAVPPSFPPTGGLSNGCGSFGFLGSRRRADPRLVAATIAFRNVFNFVN